MGYNGYRIVTEVMSRYEKQGTPPCFLMFLLEKTLRRVLKMKKYFVYIHINKINDKKYIGITCTKPTYRWGRNGNGYKGQRFFNAINKYGWDNFEHIVIAKNLTETQAKNMETELIVKHRTTDEKYGYNMTFGGESEIPSEATRAKMSDAQKNRVLSEETKRNISEAIGNANRKRIVSKETREKMRKSKLGVTLSEESRKKLSESKKGYVRSEESKKKQSLNHADVKGKNNPMYGKKFTDEHRKKISRAHKGKKLSEEHKEKLRNRKGELSPVSKDVVQLTLDGEFLNQFTNITEAASVTKSVRQHISKCCKGERKQTGGYKWMYLEEYEKLKVTQ